jgi:hypothetical protein
LVEVVKSGVDEVDVDVAADVDEFVEFGERKVVLILSPSPPSPPPPPNIIIRGVRVEIKNTTKKRQMSKKWNFFDFILLIEFNK